MKEKDGLRQGHNEAYTESSNYNSYMAHRPLTEPSPVVPRFSVRQSS